METLIKGKQAQIGEVRVWAGKKYRKTPTGWRPIGNAGNRAKIKSDPVEGNHYKKSEMEPIDFCSQANLNFYQGNVLKYINRHSFKNGFEDLEKAAEYCKMAKEKKPANNLSIRPDSIDHYADKLDVHPGLLHDICHQKWNDAIKQINRLAYDKYGKETRVAAEKGDSSDEIFTPIPSGWHELALHNLLSIKDDDSVNALKFMTVKEKTTGDKVFTRRMADKTIPAGDYMLYYSMGENEVFNTSKDLANFSIELTDDDEKGLAYSPSYWKSISKQTKDQHATRLYIYRIK